MGKPITKKPLEVRMGKGKGAPEYFVAVVKPGRIMFEVAGVDINIAKEALRLAAQKLPVKTKFVIANDDELNDKLGAFQKNLHDMKLTHAVSPLENPLQIR